MYHVILCNFMLKVLMKNMYRMTVYLSMRQEASCEWIFLFNEAAVEITTKGYYIREDQVHSFVTHSPLLQMLYQAHIMMGRQLKVQDRRDRSSQQHDFALLQFLGNKEDEEYCCRRTGFIWWRKRRHLKTWCLNRHETEGKRPEEIEGGKETGNQSLRGWWSGIQQRLLPLDPSSATEISEGFSQGIVRETRGAKLANSNSREGEDASGNTDTGERGLEKKSLWKACIKWRSRLISLPLE